METNHPNHGSNLDDVLREEGILNEANEAALERVRMYFTSGSFPTLKIDDDDRRYFVPPTIADLEVDHESMFNEDGTVNQNFMTRVRENMALLDKQDRRSTAQFYYFKESGKYYTAGRGFIPNEDVYYDRKNIATLNDGKMPGLSTMGYGFLIVVIPDDSSVFGWPQIIQVQHG